MFSKSTICIFTFLIELLLLLTLQEIQSQGRESGFEPTSEQSKAQLVEDSLVHHAGIANGLPNKVKNLGGKEMSACFREGKRNACF
jgi:hypothetical protein